MKAEEILEGNGLVALFLGYPTVGGGTITFTDGTKKPSEINWKFHKDWNLLMEVVEKIETLQWEEDGDIGYFVVQMFKTCCDIERDNHHTVDFIQVSGQKDKITAVWIAVVEFCKWYDQNKG